MEYLDRSQFGLLGQDVVEQRVSWIAGVIVIVNDQRKGVAVPGRDVG